MLIFIKLVFLYIHSSFTSQPFSVIQISLTQSSGKFDPTNHNNTQCCHYKDIFQILVATTKQLSMVKANEIPIPCAFPFIHQSGDWRQNRLCLLGKASHSVASPKCLDWLSTLPAFNVGSRKALTHYSRQRPSPFLF